MTTTVPGLQDILDALPPPVAALATNIPDFPGVPALLNNLPGPIGDVFDLVSDTFNFGALSSGVRQWGLYLGVAPAIVFDSFVSIDYRREWDISDYQIETGGFETYNKVDVPFNIHARFSSGGSESNRAALLASVEAVAGTTQLFNLATPEKVYRSVNVQHVDYRRTNNNGVGLIVVEIWLLEIRERVVETATSGSADDPTMKYTIDVKPVPADQRTPDFGPSAPLANTFDPSGTIQYNNGFVSPIQSDVDVLKPQSIHIDPNLGFAVY
jgi:hypothetical protein